MFSSSVLQMNSERHALCPLDREKAAVERCPQRTACVLQQTDRNKKEKKECVRVHERERERDRRINTFARMRWLVHNTFFFPLLHPSRVSWKRAKIYRFVAVVGHIIEYLRRVCIYVGVCELVYVFRGNTTNLDDCTTVICRA